VSVKTARELVESLVAAKLIRHDLDHLLALERLLAAEPSAAALSVAIASLYAHDADTWAKIEAHCLQFFGATVERDVVIELPKPRPRWPWLVGLAGVVVVAGFAIRQIETRPETTANEETIEETTEHTEAISEPSDLPVEADLPFEPAKTDLRVDTDPPFEPEPFEPTPAEPEPAEPKPAEPPTKATLELHEGTGFEFEREEREPGWPTLVFGALSWLLATFGVACLFAPIETEDRKKQREERQARAAALRRANAEKPGSNELSYRVEYHPPFPESVADDLATMLSRLRSDARGDALDVERTLASTVHAGGRLMPVMELSRQTPELLVLVDVEHGDHPFLAGVNWLLARWQATGLRLLRFDFSHRVNERLVRQPKLTRIEFESMVRRTSGMPVLLFSRGISLVWEHGRHQKTAGWLDRSDTWAKRVFVDLDPNVRAERSGPARHALDELAQRGFLRVPFTPDGLDVAARHLAGQFPGAALEEPLAPLSDSKVDLAVRRWLAAGARVPDPTWAQMEVFRREFAEIAQALPDPRYIQRAIEWVSNELVRRGLGHDASTAGGRQLALDQLVADLPADASLLKRAHQLLLAQLEGAKPKDDDPSFEMWKLKYAYHRAIVEPARSDDIVVFLDGALGPEAKRMIEGAVERGELSDDSGANLGLQAREQEPHEVRGVRMPPRVSWRRLALIGLGSGFVAALGSWAAYVVMGPPVVVTRTLTVPNGAELTFLPVEPPDGAKKPDDGEGKVENSTAPAASGPIVAMDFSPNGSRLAVSDRGLARLWRVSTGKPQLQLAAAGEVTKLALSNTRIITASPKNEIRLWSASSGRLEKLLGTVRGGVTILEFSAQGSHVAAATATGRVHVWAIPSGTPVMTVDAHDTDIRAVALSPDGKLLAVAAGAYGRVALWNVASDTKTFERLIEGSGEVVLALAFSPDGTKLASGNTRGIVRAWWISPFALHFQFAGHAGDVVAVAWSAGQMVSASMDGEIRLWDTEAGELRETLPGWPEVLELSASQDDKPLVIASRDGRVERTPSGTHFNASMPVEYDIRQPPPRPQPPKGKLESRGTGSVFGYEMALAHTQMPMRLNWLSGGEFTMGERDGGFHGDAPRHRVALSHFAICTTEVSAAQYEVVMGERPHESDADDIPVRGVNWLSAARFMNALTKRENKSRAADAQLTKCYNEQTWVWDRACTGYRLPTEAEWEYAARAGTTTDWWFGNDPKDICKYGNVDTDCDDGFPNFAPVETERLQPNAWGLHGMIGNVSEWVFDAYYQNEGAAINPVYDASGTWRVFRGGALEEFVIYTKAGRRGSGQPDDPVAVRLTFVGFRCARGPVPE
jgi:formylglycine-generating enzyme required for sulfatase activity